MPTPFIEQRFPVEISYGSTGGPTFSTTVFESSSGYEQRNVNWSKSRCRYDVSHGIKTHADMEDILNFFYTVRGKATAFRYKDWSDYILTQELIATGDGATLEFQVIKTYSVGASQYVRDIKKLVQPAAGPPPVVFEVYVNSVLVTSGYTVDYNTGIITFAVAPTIGHTIKVTGEFDVPVRFDTDEMEITLESFDLETWDGIPLVEVKTNA